MPNKLLVSTCINAPIATVWTIMTHPDHIIHWCFASDDWHCPKAIGEGPKVGGIFTNTFAAKDGSLQFDLTARYDIVEPMTRLVYTLGEMKEFFLDAGRQVEVTFEETAEGTKIVEIFDAEDIHPEEMQIAGWSAILENLRIYAEKQ